MMTMFPRASFYLFFILVILFGDSCKDAQSKEQTKPQNKLFTLSDATQIELPNTFLLSENLNSESQFVAEVYADFLARLKTPPMKVTFFVDSLAPNHHLAAYQVDFQAYNQNMAALLNTKLTQQFQRFDENQLCFDIQKAESMQYASKKWNALKFKFKSDKDNNQGENVDCLQDFRNGSHSSFITIFYYNGQDKAYFFLEYFSEIDDLDAYLRKTQL